MNQFISFLVLWLVFGVNFRQLRSSAQFLTLNFGRSHITLQNNYLNSNLSLTAQINSHCVESLHFGTERILWNSISFEILIDLQRDSPMVHGVWKLQAQLQHFSSYINSVLKICTVTHLHNRFNHFTKKNNYSTYH